MQINPSSPVNKAKTLQDKQYVLSINEANKKKILLYHPRKTDLITPRTTSAQEPIFCKVTPEKYKEIAPSTNANHVSNLTQHIAMHCASYNAH